MASLDHQDFMSNNNLKKNEEKNKSQQNPKSKYSQCSDKKLEIDSKQRGYSRDDRYQIYLENNNFLANEGKNIVIPVSKYIEIPHSHAKLEKFEAESLSVASLVLTSNAIDVRVVEGTTAMWARNCFIEAGGRGNRVVLMNFASHHRPCGGYESGARAQEEDLCRKSPILAQSLINVQLLKQHSFYSENWNQSIMITEDVTFIRDENFKILKPEDYYTCTVITAAAPNMGNFKDKIQYSENKVKNILRTVLDQTKSTDIIILGAFGCGVFKNNPEDISRMFCECIKERRDYIPAKILFAIPDESGENFKSFKQVIESEF